MIYITGDIHGEVFRVAEAVDRLKITAEDVIVILGDVGMNYYGNFTSYLNCFGKGLQVLYLRRCLPVQSRPSETNRR